MKWKLVSTSLNGIKEYHLIKEDKLLIVLKYSQEQQSARITFEGDHSIFLLESSNGFPGNRIILKNAYGVDLGKFSFNRRNLFGYLQISDSLFHYSILEENQQPRLIIYKESKDHPIAVCDLMNITTVPYEYACLVLSICWFASVQKAEV